MKHAFFFSFFALATALNGGQVGDYVAANGGTTNGGDGTPVTIWHDQNGSTDVNLSPSGTPKWEASGSAIDTGTVFFESIGDSFSPVDPFVLRGKRAYSAIVSFKPESNGGQRVGDAGRSSSTLIGTVGAASNSRGFVISFNDDTIFFSRVGGGGTLSITAPRTLVNEWWTVVASSNSTGGTFSLLDQFGAVVETVWSDVGQGALANTSFNLGSEFGDPAELRFHGKMTRVQLFDHFIDEAEVRNVALASSANANLHLHEVTSNAESGVGTLREAVAAASASSGGDLIVFDPSIIFIIQSSGEYAVDGFVRVVGGSLADGKVVPFADRRIRVSGNNSSRHFNVASTGHLWLENLWLRNGAQTGPFGGGSILNRGDYLTLENCTFSNCSVDEGSRGGAIYSLSRVRNRIVDCLFENNHAGDAEVVVATPTNGGTGGAICFDGNGDGVLEVIRSDFFFNEAGEGFEGGTGGSGGAVDISGAGMATFEDCEFENNLAGDAAFAGTAGSGGAIRNANGPLYVYRSFFYRNEAGTSATGTHGSGGAIESVGNLGEHFQNSTFHQNRASNTGSATVSGENAIYRYCTIHGNQNSVGVSCGSFTNRATFENTVVSFHSGNDVEGFFTVKGTCVIENHTGNANGTGTLESFLPTFHIGLFRLNGARTRALLPNDEVPERALIDRGDDKTGLVSTDQQGRPRIYGAAADVGAVEVVPMFVFGGSAVVVEDYGDVVIPVSLTRTSETPMSITVTTENENNSALAGEDYEAKTETLTFAPGETEKVFRVLTYKDVVEEDDAEFINLLTPGLDPNQLLGIVPYIRINPSGGHPVDLDKQSGLPAPPPRSTSGPIADAAGTYSGLVTDSFGGSTVYGTLTGIKVRADGSFSAKLVYRGESFGLKGHFDESTAVFTQAFTSKDGGTDYLITLTIGQTGTAFAGWKIDGTIDRTGFNPGVDSLVTATGVYFDGKLKVAPEAGTYTLLFDKPDSTGGFLGLRPAGTGYAALSVSTKGRAKITGVMGDGTKLSTSGIVSRDKELTIYRVLSRSKPVNGHLAGVLQFRDTVGISDIDGALHWTKYPNAKSKRYPDGFLLVFNAVGSEWIRPATGERALAAIRDEEQNVRFTFENENLPTTVSRMVTWDTNNRIRHFGPYKFSAKLNPKNGLVTGSYSWNGVKFKYGSALFQKQSVGFGVMTYGDQTGKLTIEHENVFVDDFDPSGDPSLEYNHFNGDLTPAAQPSVFTEAHAGRYYGNLEQDGVVKSFKLATTGAFSTVFYSRGEKFVVKGTIDPTGSFVGTTTTRSGRELTLLIRSEEVPGSGEKRVTIRVEETGEPPVTGELYRADYNKRTNPAGKAGQYTMIVNDPIAPVASDPVAHGYGVLTIDKNGRIRVSGLLADRTKFSSTTYLSADNSFQIWSNLYRTKPQRGYFSTIMKFDNLPPNQGEESDASGEMFWKKLPDIREKQFADGFEINTNVIITKYTRPGRGERAYADLANGYHNAELLLEKNLPVDPIINVFTWFSNNRTKFYGTERIRIKVNSKNGIVSGSRRDGSDITVFSGVLYQRGILEFDRNGVITQKTGMVRGSHSTNKGEPGDLTIRAR